MDNKTKEVQYLLIRYFDGAINAEEFGVLNRYMHSDPEVIKLYFRTLKVYLALRQLNHLSTLPELSEEEFKRFLIRLYEHERAAPAIRIEDIARKPEPRKQPARINKMSVAALAAAVAAVFFMVLFVNVVDMPEAVPEIGFVSHARNATFYNEIGEQKSVSDLLPGGEYILSRGHVELTFYAGTQIKLDAPAGIEIESEERIILRKGSLQALVPEGIKGFTVSTRNCSVVDYGTEFKVSLTDSGDTDVEVLDGVVDVRNSFDPMLFGKSQKLIAGQACKVDKRGQISLLPRTKPPKMLADEKKIYWTGKEPVSWNTLSCWGSDTLPDQKTVCWFAEEGHCLIDAGCSGPRKATAMRVNLGVIGGPAEIRMTGGHAVFEELWIGRTVGGQGIWRMEGGLLEVTHFRKTVNLRIGDTTYGLLEFSDGRIRADSDVFIGTGPNGHGEFVMTGGEFTAANNLMIGMEDHRGDDNVYGEIILRGGTIRANDLYIHKGEVVISGGKIVLNGDRRYTTMNYIDKGKIKGENGRRINVTFNPPRSENDYGATVITVE